MTRLISLWTFADPNATWVLFGAALLGIAAGLLGCFPFLKRRALVGDALAHAALPGVTTAYLLFHNKALSVLLLGAAISCMLGAACIDYLSRHTKVKEDSAFAMILSIFFALGIFQLTQIQALPLASQSGIDTFLLGQASALVDGDVALLSGLAILLILCIVLFYRNFRNVTFDPLFSSSIGFSVARYELFLGVLVVITVVIGMQLVGVVLMAAVLLIPPAAARYWTDSLPRMLILSSSFGAIAGVCGTSVSYMYPRMPTGPWMVLCCTMIFTLSLIFAPRKGMLVTWLQQRNYAKRLAEENVLRSMHLLMEHSVLESEPTYIEGSMILKHRSLSAWQLEKVLARLRRKGLVHSRAGEVCLTQEGLEYAKRLTRLHRLWESYLTKHTEIAADHVHTDAEEIEHILTAELEAALLETLHDTDTDPHGRSIPGKS